MRDVYVEQLSLPLAYLARDDHGLDVGPLHQRHDGAGYLIERRDVERGRIEDDYVGLPAWRERPDFAVEPQGLGSVDGRVAQHIARRQRSRYSGGRCRPIRKWAGNGDR